MALSPNLDHEFLASVFSAESIRQQVSVGNITQDDADLAISLLVSGDPSPFEEFPLVLVGLADSVESTIIDTIDSQAGAALDLPFGIDDKIKGWINDALEPILDLLDGIPQRVIAELDATGAALTDIIEGFASGALTSIGNVAGVVSDLVAGLDDKIAQPVIEALSIAQDAFNTIDDKVRDVVNVAVAPIAAVTNTVLDKVEGFATALRDTIPELAGVLGGALESATDTIGDAVKDAFLAFIESTGLGGLKPVLEAMARIPELVDPMGAFSPTLEEKMPAKTLEEYRKNVPGMITLMIPFVGSLAGIIFSGQVDRVRQASAGDHNSGMIPIGDVSRLSHMQLATPAQVRDVGWRSGLNESEVDQITELVKLRPGTMDIIDYWRRELLTDREADEQLTLLGWDSFYRNKLKEAAFPPPGVQDIIRMAVREVFSPEVAEAFGQFEEIPQPYLMWAKRIGLSEEWARNYWASHWVLPSVQQGFQMLHRSVITEEDLERLFVALDVMPFWRAPIKAISFRPFTRVDVRRMYSFGVLDRAGVKRAYLDLGFDEDKGEKMTDFTVKWVDGSRKVEKEKERDLTKGDIIGLFNDGLIDEQATLSHLESMGFDSNESRLLVDREILQELRRDRKADIAVILDQAKIKVLSFNDAQDRLHGLDLTPREMEKALIEVTRATTARVRLPSKADLDSWRELKLISPDQYASELDGLGFPSKYIALYTEAIELEEADDLLAAETRTAKKAEPKSITKGALDSLLRSETIDIEEYETGLVEVGFIPRDVNRFLEQITVELEERRIEDEARRLRGEKAAEREKLISRVVLGRLLIKGIIEMTAYEEGLRKLGFSPDSIELLSRLIVEKIEADDT